MPQERRRALHQRRRMLRKGQKAERVAPRAHRQDCGEDRYSRRVSLKEIQENDYNLNITRYVSLAQEEAQIDLAENHKKLVNIEKSIKESKDKLNVFLKELGLEEIQ